VLRLLRNRIPGAWHSPSSDITEAFDVSFYRALNADLAPLTDHALFKHFMAKGWVQGLDPTPYFSVRRYLTNNPDVAKAKINPFEHYIKRGRFEGRQTHLSFWGRDKGPELPASLIEKVRHLFDADLYRAQLPDLAHLSADALLSHYLVLGWLSNLSPNANFSGDAYLEAHPDVRIAGTNPFVHFALYGQREGRQLAHGPFGALPSGPQSHHVEKPTKERVDPKDLDTVRDAFNPAFYRATNPDVEAASDEDLLIHFMETGWHERRDPSPDFSTSYYLDTYPDILLGGINPFLHYVLFGAAEGRRSRGNAPVRLAKGGPNASVPQHLQMIAPAPQAGSRKPSPPNKINLQNLNQHWIIPDFKPGSGGHMTIFRMIKFQETFGHRCKIWIETPVFHETPQAAWETIVKHFQCVAADVDFVANGFTDAQGDAVIATGWSTAYLARAATGFHGKFYFVQDHEVEFYPTGAERLLAEQTYHFGLSCICASPWLENLMRTRYGQWARSFHLAYDPDIYNVAADQNDPGQSPRKPLRIAVYARDHTERRCVALSLLALEQLALRRDDFEVHFFGQAVLPFFKAGYTATNHGVLSAEKLAELYRLCDVGICFSGTNYSLVPKEMMACGLPVLELDTDSTRTIFPIDVVTFAGPDPADIADKIAELLDNPAQRARQAKLARDWATGFSWEASAQIVQAAIRDRLTELQPDQIAAPRSTIPRQTALDVIIPTWNGIGEIEAVIAALRRQSMAEVMQIYCIDSASSDGTTQWLRAQRDIALIEIEQAEFQHGRTRNLAAAAGASPLIAFLTQDAIPATTTWAQDIFAMFEHSPTAAGLFGRHLPYPHHPSWVRHEIETHFENMLRHPLVLSRDTDPEKWKSGDPGWRQLLHFYSDNNSAMRRSIWRDHPYPEVDYGEDQIWARDIIEAGHAKIYAPTACVYHSHDYDAAEKFNRAKIEAEFFFIHFGYALGDGSELDLSTRIEREKLEYRAWAYRNAVTPSEEARQFGNIEAKHMGWRAGLEKARTVLAEEVRKA
jgi:glycosyltransferase involved in cell wall biosynthesis/GT2 family glycosyltransferase